MIDSRASTACLSPVIRVTVASLTPSTTASVRFVQPRSSKREKISCPGARKALGEIMRDMLSNLRKSANRTFFVPGKQESSYIAQHEQVAPRKGRQGTGTALRRRVDALD